MSTVYKTTVYEFLYFLRVLHNSEETVSRKTSKIQSCKRKVKPEQSWA